jgi:PAS domain S-box-containing protein
LLEVAPDAMVITGADGRMAHVNTQAEKLLGYSQEQLLGQRIDLLMPKPPKQHKGKQGPQPEIRPFGHGFETMVRRRNGTELAIVINLGFLEVGADTLISSAFREIQPEPSEELNLRALVDASDDAIIGKKLDGTIVVGTKGQKRFTGTKRGDSGATDICVDTSWPPK